MSYSIYVYVQTSQIKDKINPECGTLMSCKRMYGKQCTLFLNVSLLSLKSMEIYILISRLTIQVMVSSIGVVMNVPACQSNKP